MSPLGAATLKQKQALSQDGKIKGRRGEVGEEGASQVTTIENNEY